MAIDGLQGLWSLVMALRIVRSFRMQAVSASFFGLPAAQSRS
jgi:hypothetical protein